MNIFTTKNLLKIIFHPKQSIIKIYFILRFFCFKIFQKFYFYFSKKNSVFIFNQPQEALNLVAKYLPQNPIILEAGAFLGTESLYLAKFWPACKLHSFEPIPQHYQTLNAVTKNHTNIKTYNLALGDKNGKSDFYVSALQENPSEPSQSSSLLQPKKHLTYAPYVIFNNKIDVNVTTIDSWADEHNINQIDFMWLDLQGSELQALKASPKILKTVKAILTEIEFTEAYKNQPLFKEVTSWLDTQGFKLVAMNHKYVWFGDALFIKKEILNQN